MTSTTERPPKRRRDRAAREREILEAAERIFGERGYQGTSMDDVAAKVGVSKPLIYQYYGSKDGLFREILRRRVDETASGFTGRDVASDDRLARSQRNLADDTEYIRLLAWEALETRPSQPVNAAHRSFIAHLPTWRPVTPTAW